MGFVFLCRDFMFELLYTPCLSCVLHSGGLGGGGASSSAYPDHFCKHSRRGIDDLNIRREARYQVCEQRAEAL